MQNLVSTTQRCMGIMPISQRKPLATVARIFVASDGGKPNIAAKTLATLWYLLILPDAQTRFNREIHRKRMPWYAPTRVFGLMLAASNIVTMPLSWALLFAGKRNASRISAAGVLVNPPTITLTLLLVTELTSAIINRTCRVVKASSNTISKPFTRKSQQSQSSNNTSTGNTTSVNTAVTPTAAVSETARPDSNLTESTQGSTNPASTKSSSTTTVTDSTSS